jgi:hypothetical protein
MERWRGCSGATMQQAVDAVARAIQKGERQGRQDVARWAPRDNRVCSRRRHAPHHLPGKAEQSKLRNRELLLQARQEFVLLVANVSLEQAHDTIQHLPVLGRAGLQRLQPRHQLVDLLVLELDTKRELLTVRHDAPDHRPEHGFLCKGVREHQPVDLQKDRIFAARLTFSELMEQAIKPDVVAPLAGENTHAPTHPGDALLGD